MQMLRSLTLALATASLTLTLHAEPTPYPETPRIPIQDTFHGTAVSEDYRWLEDRKDSPGTARTLIAVCGATLAATFVNPFGVRVWSYAAGIGTNPTISARVTEWAPPTVHEYSGVVFFASALVIVGYLIRRGTPVSDSSQPTPRASGSISAAV